MGLPAFAPKDARHARLAALSQQAHALADQLARGVASGPGPGQPAAKADARLAQEQQAVEAEIDTLAAALWGIWAAELQAIQASPSDLQ